MNAFIGRLMWLRTDVAVSPPDVAAVVVVVDVEVDIEQVDDCPQTTPRLDLLPQRTMRADSIFSVHARS